MILAFYKVSNSKNYGRHTFDYWYHKPEVIKKMLYELSDEELRMYDMDNSDDIDSFQEDYNDEELDGGWWCVLIR